MKRLISKYIDGHSEWANFINPLCIEDIDYLIWNSDFRVRAGIGLYTCGYIHALRLEYGYLCIKCIVEASEELHETIK